MFLTLAFTQGHLYSSFPIESGTHGQNPSVKLFNLFSTALIIFSLSASFIPCGTLSSNFIIVESRRFQLLSHSHDLLVFKTSSSCIRSLSIIVRRLLDSNQCADLTTYLFSKQASYDRLSKPPCCAYIQMLFVTQHAIFITPK